MRTFSITRNRDGPILGELVRRYGAAVDAELRRVISDNPLPLYDMLRYHMGWVDENGRPSDAATGKRLRPVLCLVSCEAVGGNVEAALPAAAALELVHNFTLVHDDVMDEDHERRHRRTVWSRWGSAQAINAGDLLYAVAIVSMSHLDQRGVSAENAVKAIRRLEQTCIQVIEGQYLDMEFETRLDVSPDEYLEMISKKSAALISFPMEVGALVGGADEELQLAFAEVGRATGMAFQIRDDILGVWGRQELTGKPVGSDIRRKKKSLPILMTFEAARSSNRAFLRKVYERPGLPCKAVTEILRLMDALEIRKSVEALASKYADAAKSSIQELPVEARAKDELTRLVDFIVSRDS
ncbi:MAG: polyprenyl synthetase family protein [Chloroflexi bacterium]|nr:polyprenyl synthetase family protein [Chloroflexota bacterium]